MITALIVATIVVSLTFCYLLQYIVEGNHILNEDLDSEDEI